MKDSLRNFLKILLTGIASGLVIGMLVGLFGWLRGWKTATEFSDGLFVTGSAIIIFGLLSVWGGFTMRGNFDVTYAQTASDASLPERAKQWSLDVLRGYNVLATTAIIGVVVLALSILVYNIFG